MLISPSELARFIFTTYWLGFALVLIIFLLITFKTSQSKKGKIIGSVISLALTCTIFFAPIVYKKMQHQAKIDKAVEQGIIEKTKTKQEKKAAYRSAREIFKERCKTAGEKIYRTVEDVEGVTLLRVSPLAGSSNPYNPMWEDAALGFGTDYIYSFLGTTFPDYTFHSFLIKPKDIYTINDTPYVEPIYGYGYVDVRENKKYFRYKLPLGKSEEIIKPLEGKPARYAVTYETPINKEDRKHWIASATIKVIDTKDNSLMAKKIIYVMDPGHGAGQYINGVSSGRQPWAHAIRCSKDEIKRNAPRFFVEKVLKPKQPKLTTKIGE